MNRAIAAVLLALGGCSVPAQSTCFQQRHVVLPKRELTIRHASNGEAGRRILEAAWAGDAAGVIRMLRHDPRLAATTVGYPRGDGVFRPAGQYGDLLTVAVAQCDAPLLGALLGAGVPPDGAQPGQALTLALLADTPEMAELLLRHGASPDPQKSGDPDAVNVFTEVTAFDQVGAVMMLLRHGLDLTWHDRFGDGHLQHALDMEQYRIAQLLLEHGANPWSIGVAGNMPAQQAVKPPVLRDAAMAAARTAIAARIAADAQTRGLPWPPPAREEVIAKFRSGAWPTAAMVSAGMIAPPDVLAAMRARHPPR